MSKITQFWKFGTGTAGPILNGTASRWDPFQTGRRDAGPVFPAGPGREIPIGTRPFTSLVEIAYYSGPVS